MHLNIKSFFKKNTYLFLVVTLAFVLRVVAIAKIPPSLNWDEISHGYNAYSILKTGKDQWGQIFPLVNFRAYGDYPLPLNLYLTIPPILIFGLNEFSIRFPHVLFGLLTVLASYFLCLGLTKNKKLSLFVSFLVAIEPWTVFTSRIVLQQNLSVMLLVISAAFFVNRNNNKNFTFYSLLSLFLSLFAYHTTRIFSPILLVMTVFIFRSEVISLFKQTSLFKKILFLSLPLFLIVSLFILLEPNARARSQWLFIVNQASINKIIEARQKSDLSDNLKRIIYNRPTYFITQFTKNYLGYFSPQFLFLRGGTQYQYSLPNWGLSYIVNLPFFYLGLLALLRKAMGGDKKYQFILLWLMLSPIAGSITSEQFAVTRASLMIPLPQILSGIGLFSTLTLLNRKSRKARQLLVVIYSISLLATASGFYFSYFKYYSVVYSEAWQYGYKEVVSYIKVNYQDYDKVIVTKNYGEPHEYLLFFWPWDPQQYLKDPNKITFYQSGWWWVDRFDKFYFVNDWQVVGSDRYEFVQESKGVVRCVDTQCLLITSPGNVPEGWKKLKTINFLDGKAAFEIYDNK